MEKIRTIFFLVIIAFIVTACTIPGLSVNPISTSTPFMPDATLEDIADARSHNTIWFASQVPELIRQQVGANTDFSIVANSDDAMINLQEGSEGIIVSQWVYCLVAAFPTILDDVTSQDFIDVWQGTSKMYPQQEIILTQTDADRLDIKFGTHGEEKIHIVSGELIQAELWNNLNAWGIIPFELLIPSLKVISIDSVSPLENQFDREHYPLIIPFSIRGDTVAIQEFLKQLEEKRLNLALTNRDPELFTSIILTGTTALTRVTAYKMFTKGVLYPGEEVRNILRAADFTHISNEVSFSSNCADPYASSTTMQFCSQTQNIQLLEDIDADIIELTGNHLIDFGYEPLNETIQMYRDRGWLIYGGGDNAIDAQQPITFEHHGNKFAMLGCNVVGPDFDWAGYTTPGSARCEFEWMISQIQTLSSQGYLVIVTLQDYESDAPMPSPSVREDFIAMADAGAIIVSGSQAHSPQGFEFVHDSFIHYGLGNLFFDQMYAINTRREFIDRHVFYNGRYINTQIITTFLEDYAKPRLMSLDERQDFLEEIFQFSGW
jgi:hypothetical protein